MKDLYLMDKLELRREIFDLFENARILFNDYYNGKEEYSEKDIIKIYDLILKVQDNVSNIESVID